VFADVVAVGLRRARQSAEFTDFSSAEASLGAACVREPQLALRLVEVTMWFPGGIMTEPMHVVRRPPSSDEIAFPPGEPMESTRHLQQMNLLVQSLEHAWQDRRDFFCAGDLWVYFSETQTKKQDFRGPDFLLVMDTTRRERKAWIVWEEDGKTPDVVVEVLSDTTEKNDRGPKMRIYERLGVAEYFLFDPFSGAFEGYELDAVRGAYRPKAPDASGRLRCARAGLFLGKVMGTFGVIEADWLRWIADDGRVLPMPEETARLEAARADAEAARADAEAARADAEAARAAALEAELRRLRGDG
jgi:Uma2 family endonuclease